MNTTWSILLTFPDGSTDCVYWKHEPDEAWRGTSDEDWQRDDAFSHWAKDEGAVSWSYIDDPEDTFS